MTTNELPVCPSCEQDVLRRCRLSGLDPVYLVCVECDAMWSSEGGKFDESQARRFDLSNARDIVWIDLPFKVDDVMRLEGHPSVVGVITGVADNDGRVYDVEFIDEYGALTHSGRIESDRIYPASEVWRRRYLERRAKAADS